MGCTSVTGKGLGSAVGSNKGSEHMTLGVGHLLGPRVIAAGTVTLAEVTEIDVVLPLLDGEESDYVVMTNDVTAAAASFGVLDFGTATTLTITGTSDHDISWTIIKAGTSGLVGIGS